MAKTRIPPLALVLLSGLLILIYVPVTLSMIRQGGDFVMHIQYAYLWELSEFYGKPLPHFLYQLVLVGFRG